MTTQSTQLSELERKNTEFRTICRDCLFAQFTPDLMNQNGCELGRLSKYLDKNLTILKKDEETDVEYYEIKTVCTTNRENSSQFAKENSLEDCIKLVKKQIEVKVDFLVLADAVRVDWESLLLKTAEDFTKHTIKPAKIIFGFHQKKILFHELLSKLDKIFLNTNITYELVNVLDDVHDSWQLIDILFKKVKNQYFTICKLGDELPHNWIDKINNFINVDLNNLSMLEPINGLTGLTIQKFLYSVVGGSMGVNILDKVKDLAKNQNLSNMVCHWDEL